MKKSFLRSFTLIEALLIVVFFSTFLLVFFSMLSLLTRIFQKTVISQKIIRSIDLITNTIRYTIKNYAIEVYADSNLSIKCTHNSPLTNLNKIYFLDKNKKKFYYFLDNTRIASASESLSQNLYLNSDQIKIENLKFGCSQKKMFSPPIISIYFEITSLSDLIYDDYRLVIQTKVKMKNY